MTTKEGDTFTKRVGDALPGIPDLPLFQTIDGLGASIRIEHRR